MGDIISTSQGAFVKDRQILDEILIANECVEELKVKKGKGIMCKENLEKAYDQVDWNFLDYVMNKKGFGIKWIAGCISSVHYAVLINGISKGFFHAKQGLKQGDLLSPFLFTLVSDNLNCLIKRAEEWGLVKGFKVENNNVSASHLQFANDTIIFCEAHRSYINNISSLLKCFERISG